MTQPLLLTDRPAYFPSGMHYVYDGRSKRYPRQPVLPDLSTREVLGTDVGSALGRRMIAMRQISGGHEIRPRGGLLLVTTLHFYLYRYFPIAIDSIDQRAFIS